MYRIVTRGIPSEHRPTLWKILLRVEQRKAENVGLYDKYKQFICEVAMTPEDGQPINKRENQKERTKFFLDNISKLLVRLPVPDLSSSIKGTRLTHTWIAYILHHEGFEMFSSMGYQFSLLVEIFENEEDIFWAETALNEIYSEFYQVEKRIEEEYCKLFIFEKLLQKNFPKILEHFVRATNPLHFYINNVAIPKLIFSFPARFILHGYWYGKFY